MQIITCRFTVATVVAACFVLVSIAQAQDFPGTQLRDPQREFDNPNLPAMPNSLFPGSKDDNDPSDNIVNVNSGTVAGHVYGGITTNVGQASNNNSVTIKDGVIIGSTSNASSGNVTGGWSLAGNASNNIVTIEGGTIRNIIYGGWIRGDGDAGTFGYHAINNKVFIEGGTIRDNVYGAYSQESGGTLSGNIVNIAGGEIWKNDALIVGGYSALGVNDVFGNTVTISGNTTIRVAARVYGGRGQTTSNITGNKVIIEEGLFRAGEIYGGELMRGSGTASVEDNVVDIRGGTVNATIYGGYTGAASVNNTNAVTNNQVFISGGIVSGDIYAGYSAGSGTVSGNEIEITDSTVTAGDIYGGFSTRGNATGNTVTIDGTTLTVNTIFGGAGGGNVFDGNTLNLSNFNNVEIGSVRNFQFITFNNSGTANINSIDTTVTGSTAAGVTVNIDFADEVRFQGTISGTGDLTLQNVGTLAFRGGASNNFSGNVKVENGTVAFNNANQIMSGFGKVTLLEDGKIRFDDDMTIAGKNIVLDAGALREGLFDTQGFTIEIDKIDVQSGHLTKLGTGTLIFTDNGTQMKADDTVYIKQGAVQLGNHTTTGDIVTAGGGIVIDADAALAFAHSNNFDKDSLISGRGTVIQRGDASLMLTNLNNNYTGGTEVESGTLEVRYAGTYNVADGSNYGTRAGYITFTGADTGKPKTVTVVDPTDTLNLLQNSFRTQTGAGKENYVDLTAITSIQDVITNGGTAFHVVGDTEMTVQANILALARNIDFGNLRFNDFYVEGTLNLNVADRLLVSSGTFGGGTLNITSTAAPGGTALVRFQNLLGGPFRMGTTNVIGTAGNVIQFDLVGVNYIHSGDFNLIGTGSYGSATLVGNGIITAKNISVTGNSVLALVNNASSLNGTTQTLIADTVTLDGFGLIYQPGISGGNKSLLDIQSNNVTLNNGLVAVVSPYVNGHYLIMQTSNGFTNIANNTELNLQLQAEVDGFLITPNSGSPRGTNEFKFGGATHDVLGNNVWLTHNLHSLTMDWTGGTGTATSPILWTNDGDLFRSYQGVDPNKETKFMPGDKVHFSGSGGYFISMAPTTATDGRTLVSGLVVGQSANGTDLNGSFTFTGNGGFTADAGSAFGDYLAAGAGIPKIDPTGKLQKYGSGTLAFTNAGGNEFKGGVEIYGGTVAINRADQLQTPEIKFEGTSTLQANGVVALDMPIYVASGTTATFDTPNAGTALLLNGALTPGNALDSSALGSHFTKTGAGILQIANISTTDEHTNAVRFHTTTVEGGEFHLIQNQVYDTYGFLLKSGATLSGEGTVKIAHQNMNYEFFGNISPDSAVFTENKLFADGDERFGILKFDSSDSTFNLGIKLGGGSNDVQGFSMDFDIGTKSDATPSQDLLQVNAYQVSMAKGTINFRGTLDKNTDYLIIQGDNTGYYPAVDYWLYDDDGNFISIGGSDADLNKVLKATLNGIDILAADTPRGHLEFAFGNSAVVGIGKSSIWLTNHLNSLTMNLTGAAGSTIDWAFSNEVFTSLQGFNPGSGTIYEKNFQQGDEVLVYAADGDAITVTLPIDAVVSRLVVGAKATATGTGTRGADVPQDGNVAITGSGSVTADGTSAFGEYLLTGTLDPKLRIESTYAGTLQKSGTGILTLNNEGPNVFKGGTWFYDGTIVIGAKSADTSGFSKALGEYWLSTASNNGQVEFKRVADGDGTSRTLTVNKGVTKLQNYFAVNTTENTFINEGELTISGVLSRAGAFDLVNTGAKDLTIQAKDHLTLTGNEGGHNTGTPFANDIYVDGSVGVSTLTLLPGEGKGIFIESGIISRGVNSVINIGDGTLAKLGFVQIAAESAIAGTTNVKSNGTLRIVDKKIYGAEPSDIPGVNKEHTANVEGTLAGNGTLQASKINITGTLSPDADKFTTQHTTVANNTKYAALTLQYNGSGSGAVTLGDAGNPFLFEYDVLTVNQDTDKWNTTLNDVLSITGFSDNDIVFKEGTINFRSVSGVGNTLDLGKYLIIDADSVIDDTNMNLTALVNNHALTNSPRHSGDFYLDGGDKQLWFDYEVNSLTMDWNFLNGNWNTTAGNFESLQGPVGDKETVFRAGDFVRFGGFADDVSINIDSLNTLVSGMVVNETNPEKRIMFTGTGGIFANENSPFGKFVYDPITNPGGNLKSTGKLEMLGGTVRFANSGGNSFREGIDIQGGTIEFDRANQLGGDISFTDSAKLYAALRPYANVALKNHIFIASGKKATFDVDTPHALILTGDISGDSGNEFNKTGKGILQISGDLPAEVDYVAIEEGTFRVVNQELSTIQFALEDDATLAGNGQVIGDGLFINGTISPDRALFSEMNTTIDGEEKFAALTLKSNDATILDGFTFNFDVDGDHQDLLILVGSGNVLLLDGTVDFIGTLTSGRYLIMTSEEAFDLAGKELDGINDSNGVLIGKHNGTLMDSELPRGGYQFVFGDTPATANNIYLETEINSLTMGRSSGGTWSDSNWASEEVYEGKRATEFMNYDLVKLTTVADSPVLVVNAVDVETSGLIVNGNTGTMTLTGNGITAATGLAFGKYFNEGLLVPTGKLQKFGDGTLRLENAANTFAEGIELYGGTVQFGNADQLGDGGNGIFFVDNATLNPYSNVLLPNDIMAGYSGITATFLVDNDNTLILTGEVWGEGNVVKSGSGSLQFSDNGTPANTAGNTDVIEGEFRVVGKTYGTGGDFKVAAGATLAGNGVVVGNSVEVQGFISPDSATFTESKTSVDMASHERFATLTLNSTAGTTLDGFTFNYDVASTAQHDLLALTGGGTVVLNDGVVDFQGPLSSGSYLIVTSDQVIDTESNPLNGINDPSGVLKGKLNGNDIISGLPRGGYEFVFKEANKEIWLETELNSLTMGRSSGGTWDDNNWESEEEHDGNHAKTFNDGDLVKLNGSNLYSLEVNRDVITSGLNVSGNGNITLTGSGIFATTKDGSAEGDTIEGRYFIAGELVPTGKLVKEGSGTLVFANIFNLFKEGIELKDGTVKFSNVDQLGDGGKGISFIGDSELFANEDVALQNKVYIGNNVVGSFGVDAGRTFSYSGDVTNGSTSSTLNKSGLGTVRLETPSGTSAFAGNIDVSIGTLDVAGNYRNTTQFNVKNGGTLSGTGTIGGVGTIESGGTLKPGGLSNDYNAAPVENPLTVNGNLTFQDGSNFDVRIAQYGSNHTPYSDKVVVNGAVNIATEAKLNVEIDYWGKTSDDFNYENGSHFTVIDASAGIVGNSGAQFQLETTPLPRGITMQQGWNGKLFDLWFDFDPTRGFKNLCIRHNRGEIGTTLDWFTENHDPSIRKLIDYLSNPNFSDAEVCQMLDQIHGDLAANALFMALKEPWRHPFNRLSLGCSTHKRSRFQQQLWGEFTARYENVAYDDNAHAFTINRYGLAVGSDVRISPYSVAGITYQYAEPRLRQTTGNVKMDDHEVGLYGLTRLTNTVDMKVYLGYSHQMYDLTRTVSLGQVDTLRSNTSGDALAASLEVFRPMRWSRSLCITPLAAWDFEQAWMRGFRESGSDAALVYDDASLERMMFRVGLGSELNVHKFSLNGRVQYGTQLNHREHPAIGARFANGPANQYTADIWGSQIGRDYLNLGLGTSWKLNGRSDRLLYINYDAKWFYRADIHIGEAGFVQKW